MKEIITEMSEMRNLAGLEPLEESSIDEAKKGSHEKETQRIQKKVAAYEKKLWAAGMKGDMKEVLRSVGLVAMALANMAAMAGNGVLADKLEKAGSDLYSATPTMKAGR